MTAPETLMPGQQIARGVGRLMRAMDCACLWEVVPVRGLRADIMALTPRGEIWIVECKSSRADYTSDRKWQGYLEWCDRYFWAVTAGFPDELLPAETGLIRADAWGAELVRMAPHVPLAAARRKRLTQDFARQAAWRLQALLDPNGGAFL